MAPKNRRKLNQQVTIFLVVLPSRVNLRHHEDFRCTSIIHHLVRFENTSSNTNALFVLGLPNLAWLELKNISFKK